MFNVGEKYSRTKDIHDIYGGGRQSGISPSASYPYIFLFTGDSGKAYGYEDGWQSDEGVFLYTGQGQTGDMEFSLGNKAIRDHINKLSDGGLDHPFNCAAITPNVHREIHLGANGKSLDEQLAKLILEKEADFV